MKNLKPAWKLFFTMTKQIKFLWVIILFAILSIALMVLVGVEGEVIGNEEHLLSASMTSFSYYILFFSLIILFANFTNNRFFMSCPESQRVFTRILPIMSGIITVFLFTLSIVSAVLCGYTPAMMSDILIFNALGGVSSIIAVSLVGVSYSFFFLYISFVPWTVLVLTVDNPASEFLKNLHYNGFGIPMEISAVICGVLILTAFICSFKIADHFYKKRSVRLINAVASYPVPNK